MGILADEIINGPGATLKTFSERRMGEIIRNRRLVEDIIKWDIYNWSKFLNFCEKHLAASTPGPKALEIGSRNGGLALYLALKNFSVVCSDLRFGDDGAKRLHKQYGVADRVTYDLVNVLDIKYEDNYFDVVIFKSVLGFLQTPENQRQSLEEIRRVLKPDGILLFADNSKGSGLHETLRKKFTCRHLYWRYPALREVRDFIGKFREVEIETYGFLGLFGWNEKVRRILGIVDYWTNHLIPEKSRYIIFCCARK